MAEKKFNKKFMHPTRRKLVNMIQTGEYERILKFHFLVLKKQLKEKLVIFGKKMVLFMNKNHMVR
jgi:hypothetical protein